MSPLGTLPAEEITDTEITLGTGKMLALFFGLVILCAIFFGMGFTMGKNSIRSAPELLPSPSTSARTAPASRNTSTPITTESPTQQTQSTSSTNSDNSSQTSASQNAPSSPQEQAPPAIPQSGQSYYVQVAAVSKQEDAEALVESLKGRQYSAFIANPGSDKLFHVQVGPFGDVKSAEDMRSKLVSDGYNPILKK